ncbi:hypothetical protein BN2475_720052 [Paraburkholderia ribeironis]|uniref:Uncharacterized protein n=1 Tax=Paraburkholderia ribeironis TaxID=1247936 RepID=A0A1N7SJ47_9BURK|nr:hypothetical protein BN2475_720052 [Paraburkholderia ribeironis]
MAGGSPSGGRDGSLAGSSGGVRTGSLSGSGASGSTSGGIGVCMWRRAMQRASQAAVEVLDKFIAEVLDKFIAVSLTFSYLPAIAVPRPPIDALRRPGFAWNDYCSARASARRISVAARITATHREHGARQVQERGNTNGAT